MSPLKDALCLLAILVAYGIVGRMDYDDAVMLEAAQRAAVEHAAIDCDGESADSMPASNARANPIGPDTPSDSGPCGLPPYPVAIE
jgi:hypothetical protein